MEQQTKPKVRRREEITKVRAGTSGEKKDNRKD